ncbi:MAG: hypothetical protein WC736_08905 [Gallionella sp.]|jgi:hypothetical protein
MADASCLDLSQENSLTFYHLSAPDTHLLVKDHRFPALNAYLIVKTAAPSPDDQIATKLANIRTSPKLCTISDVTICIICENQSSSMKGSPLARRVALAIIDAANRFFKRYALKYGKHPGQTPHSPLGLKESIDA